MRGARLVLAAVVVLVAAPACTGRVGLSYPLVANPGGAAEPVCAVLAPATDRNVMWTLPTSKT